MPSLANQTIDVYAVDEEYLNTVAMAELNNSSNEKTINKCKNCNITLFSSL